MQGFSPSLLHKINLICALFVVKRIYWVIQPPSRGAVEQNNDKNSIKINSCIDFPSGGVLINSQPFLESRSREINENESYPVVSLSSPADRFVYDFP